ncbi:MAG: hypothetical protein AABZ47_11715 [Planctomycetota bacterium]
MNTGPRIKIDRLVIEGRSLTSFEARELARLAMKQFFATWRGGHGGVSLPSLRLELNAGQNLSVDQLAHVIASELRQRLV